MQKWQILDLVLAGGDLGTLTPKDRRWLDCLLRNRLSFAYWHLGVTKFKILFPPEQLVDMVPADHPEHMARIKQFRDILLIKGL